MGIRSLIGDRAFYRRLFAVMLPLLVQNIISLFVLFPLCAFVSYCLVGTLALLLFPLAEDKKRR